MGYKSDKILHISSVEDKRRRFYGKKEEKETTSLFLVCNKTTDCAYAACARCCRSVFFWRLCRRGATDPQRGDPRGGRLG